MARKDISNKLIHFTSGNSIEAFKRLNGIIKEQHIDACQRVRGGFKCVCFTEAPLASLHDGLVNANAYSRYAPFGIIFDKKYIFDRGGRPVIYQTEHEFWQLPDSLKWRHVRYEPDAIDFTWEREWRIQCENLEISPETAGIVVPNQYWAERIMRKYNIDEDYKIMQYSMVMDEEIAELYREDFKWTIYRLK